MTESAAAASSDNSKQYSADGTTPSRSIGIGAFYLTDVFQLFAVIAVIVLAFVFPSFHFRGPGLTPAPVTSVLTSVLWFAVICGLGGTATVEAAKRLVGLRGLYQRNQVVRWLADRTDADSNPELAQCELDSALGLPPKLSVDLVKWLATHRANLPADLWAALPADPSTLPEGTAGARRFFFSEDRRKRRALYDLPIGQLVAQIGIAAELALADPANYEALLTAIVGETPASRVHVHTTATAAGAVAHPAENAVAHPAENRDAPVRQSQLLRAALDQLQISVADRWRRYVQGTALWLSGAYGLALGYLLNMPGRSVYVIAGLFIGGFFAWLARDLAGGVERWRRQ
jgi:hypothetical protein